MTKIIIDENYKGIIKKKDYFELNNNIYYPECDIEINIPLYLTKSITGKSLKINKMLEVDGWIKISKSLEALERLRVKELIKVGGSLKAKKALRAEDTLEVGKSLEVGGMLRVKEWLSVGGILEVGGWLYVGGQLEVGETIKVKETAKVSKWLIARGLVEIGEWLEVNEWIIVRGSLDVKKWLDVSYWIKIRDWVKIFDKKTEGYIKLTTDKYKIIITTDFIKIGCELHTIEEWKNFSDTEIRKMDEGALRWWKKWKNFIFQIHANIPKIWKI